MAMGVPNVFSLRRGVLWCSMKQETMRRISLDGTAVMECEHFSPCSDCGTPCLCDEVETTNETPKKEKVAPSNPVSAANCREASGWRI